MVGHCDPFLDAVRTRRSNYTIQKKSPTTNERIVHIVTESTKHCPSSLNTAPSRAVLLLGTQHDKFWSIVDKVNRDRFNAEDYKKGSGRVAGFAGGYGTVLFFVDEDTNKELAASYPQLAPKAHQYGEHASAMNQYMVWTALTLEGFGCSLQHFNPFVDGHVHEAWNLPASWTLTAQLVFGEPTAAPKEKSFKPIEDKVRVFT